MDVLSDMLNILNLQGTSVFRVTFRESWAVAVARQKDIAPCYIVSSGRCWIEVEGNNAPVRLGGRDAIVLPYGNAHVLRTELGIEPVPLEGLLPPSRGADEPFELEYGDSERRAVIIGGRFHLDHTRAHLLFPDSAALVHSYSGEAGAETWMDMLAALICAEAMSDRPGRHMAVSRLMDLLFLQLVRTSMTRVHTRSLLHGLMDPQVSQALEQMHQRPEHPWTVAALASQAGMSRTAFAVRFTQVVGIPPLTYLRRWRVLKASDLLSRSNAILAKIAQGIGYKSEAAFAKAFKRETGFAPGAYRQRWRAFRP